MRDRVFDKLQELIILATLESKNKSSRENISQEGANNEVRKLLEADEMPQKQFLTLSH